MLISGRQVVTIHFRGPSVFRVSVRLFLFIIGLSRNVRRSCAFRHTLDAGIT